MINWLQYPLRRHFSEEAKILVLLLKISTLYCLLSIKSDIFLKSIFQPVAVGFRVDRVDRPIAVF
jgi:hypothetical protein